MTVRIRRSLKITDPIEKGSLCSLDCPSPPTKATTRKQVTFNKGVTMRLYLHVADMTESERRAAYYQTKEYRKIKAQCIDLINKMDQEQAQEQRRNQDEDVIMKDATTTSCDTLSSICIRGLESNLAGAATRKYETRKRALFAVLSEQNYQDLMGIHDDDESIAAASRAISKASVMRARVMGLLDEQNAARCQI